MVVGSLWDWRQHLAGTARRRLTDSQVGLLRRLYELSVPLKRPAVRPEERLLNVATGTGPCLAEMASSSVQPATVIGVEPPAQCLPRRPGGWLLFEAEARALPFTDNSFDLVTVCDPKSAGVRRCSYHGVMPDPIRVLSQQPRGVGASSADFRGARPALALHDAPQPIRVLAVDVLDLLGDSVRLRRPTEAQLDDAVADLLISCNRAEKLLAKVLVEVPGHGRSL